MAYRIGPKSLQLAPSRLPLTIVCGPPGSGKSLYVQERAAPNDVVIDLDEICCRQTQLPMYAWHRQPDRSYVGAALEERDRMLMSLSHDDRFGVAAWFIAGAADREERDRWRALGPVSMVMLLVPPRECKRRVRLDPRRSDLAFHFDGVIDEWYRRYRYDPAEDIQVLDWSPTPVEPVIGIA